MYVSAAHTSWKCARGQRRMKVEVAGERYLTGWCWSAIHTQPIKNHKRVIQIMNMNKRHKVKHISARESMHVLFSPAAVTPAP